jgi:ABC-2 type transport system ATP-binding protein
VTSFGGTRIEVDFFPANRLAHGRRVPAELDESSGGQVCSDSHAFEGRDVTATINCLATPPGVELEGPSYPVVTMIGWSYGGGIQLSVAERDHRT